MRLLPLKTILSILLMIGCAQSESDNSGSAKNPENTESEADPVASKVDDDSPSVGLRVERQDHYFPPTSVAGRILNSIRAALLDDRMRADRLKLILETCHDLFVDDGTFSDVKDDVKRVPAIVIESMYETSGKMEYDEESGYFDLQRDRMVIPIIIIRGMIPGLKFEIKDLDADIQNEIFASIAKAAATSPPKMGLYDPQLKLDFARFWAREFINGLKYAEPKSFLQATSAIQNSFLTHILDQYQIPLQHVVFLEAFPASVIRGASQFRFDLEPRLEFLTVVSEVFSFVDLYAQKYFGVLNDQVTKIFTMAATRALLVSLHVPFQSYEDKVTGVKNIVTNSFKGLTAEGEPGHSLEKFIPLLHTVALGVGFSIRELEVEKEKLAPVAGQAIKTALEQLSVVGVTSTSNVQAASESLAAGIVLGVLEQDKKLLLSDPETNGKTITEVVKVGLSAMNQIYLGAASHKESAATFFDFSKGFIDGVVSGIVQAGVAVSDVDDFAQAMQDGTGDLVGTDKTSVQNYISSIFTNPTSSFTTYCENSFGSWQTTSCNFQVLNFEYLVDHSKDAFTAEFDQLFENADACYGESATAEFDYKSGVCL